MAVKLPIEIEVQCDVCGAKTTLPATHEWVDSLSAHVAYVSQEEFMDASWVALLSGRIECPACFGGGN